MAAADKQDEKEVTQNEEQMPKKKKGSVWKILIIFVIVLVVLGGAGVGAYYFVFKPAQHAGEKKAGEQKKPQVAIFWPMDPFIVNLIDNDADRYLKVVLQLELSDQLLLEELKLLKPKLRDSILDLLSSKTYKEMMDPLGKQRLRDDIALRVNAYLTEGKILKVYFTEFVIQ